MINRPKISNTTLTNAGTEYAIAFDYPHFSSFTIQCRTVADLQMAFTSGDSGVKYFTIPGGSAYSFDVGSAGISNIYVQSPIAGVVVEVLTYY